MKTTYPRKEDIKRAWHLIDVNGEVLGRISAKVAGLLKGKHKVDFSPHVDMGDGVVVINAEKVKITGKKLEQKVYKRFSGYPGGLRLEKLESLLKRRPEDVLRHAIKGMLPKTKLGRKMMKRLRVYAGDKHPHTAQEPKKL
jgi:large subunit ribosomal protein L13